MAASSSSSGGLDVSYRPALNRFHAYERAVCRIVQKGDDGRVTLCGTGFLIGPTLVLTCNHVIPDIETAKKCQAQFFKEPVHISRPTGGERSTHTYDYVKFDTSDSKKFLFRPPNRDARGNLREAKEGQLDFTILSLQQDLALSGRQYFQLFQSTIPRIGQITHLYQHPEKDSIDVSTGITFKGALAKGEGSVVLVTDHEIHYVAPAAEGSSGSPVVDASGNLMALHYQGKIGDYEGHEPHYLAHQCQRPAEHTSCNAGVRIDKIVESLDETAKAQIKAWIEEGKTHYRSLAASSSSAAASSSSAAATQDFQGSSSINVQDIPFHFVGRNATFDQLKEWLVDPPSDTRVSPALLYGPGGFGKTEGAIAFANKYRDDFSIIWEISSSTPEEQKQSYCALAEHLGVFVEAADSLRFIIQKVHEFLETYDFEKPYLLIYDNAKTYPSLPRRGKRRFLITTRNPDPFKRIRSRLRVDALTLPDAVDLLSKVLDSEEPQEQKERLAKKLDCIPLILVQAAYSINDDDECSLTEYLECLRSSPGKMLQKMEGDDMYPDSLYDVWSLTQNVLQEKDPLTYEWLQVCAHLYPDAIPSHYLDTYLRKIKGLADPTDSRKSILKTLKNQGIISYNEKKKAYFLHRVRQAIVRVNLSQASSEALIVRYTWRLLAGLVKDLEAYSMENWVSLSLWEIHVKRVEKYLPELSPSEHLAVIQSTKGDRAWTQGRYFEAKELFEKAVGIYEALSIENLGLAKALNYLGNTLSSLGKYSEAIEVHSRSLEIKRTIYPSGNSNQIAHSVSNIGNALHGLGRSDEALTKYQEALEIYQRIYKEEDHRDIAGSLHDIGNALARLGRSDEALVKHQEALEIYHRIYREQDHPDIASSLHAIGNTLHNLGRKGEALNKYQEALEMTQRIYKEEDHPDIATALYGIGYALDGLGRSDQALTKYQEALEMTQRIYKEEDHLSIAFSLNAIGSALHGLGRSDEALAKYQEALAMKKRIYRKEDHPDIASSLHDIGNALDRLGRRGEALAKYQESLEMTQRIYKEGDHPNIASSLHGIGSVLDRLGRRGEALAKYQEALEMRKRIYKEGDHPDIASSLHQIGMVLNDLGRRSEALAKYQEALEMTQRIYKEKDHPSIASSLHQIGMTLDGLGKRSDALTKFQESLAMRKRLYKEGDHPDIATSLYQAGKVLDGLGRSNEASDFFERAVKMAEGTLGRFHPCTLAFYEDLAIRLKAFGKTKESEVYQEKAIMGRFSRISRLSSQLLGNPISGAEFRQVLQEGMDQFFRNWIPPEDSPGMGSSTVASSSRFSEVDLTIKLTEIISEIEAFERDPFSATAEKREALIQKIMELTSSGLDPKDLSDLCDRVLRLPQNSSGASSSSAGA